MEGYKGDSSNPRELPPDALFERDSWILPATLEIIEHAGQAFKKKLEKDGWSTDEVFGLFIGFHEALVNAVVYGSLGIADSERDLEDLVKEELEKNPGKKDRKVYVSMEISEERVYMRIRDEGKGFDFRDVSDPEFPQGVKRFKGRGMSLMRVYFDSVDYIGNGNEVILEKKRKNN